ncbi:UNVERIFIED_CONTAM: hypothetical protein Slati_1759000 [Sesamum latifolium]|uniref:Uncharacterized protein n=1 Tax=Sesamum latifolium TaxID=2727402 RepID=A0AAW2WZR7_9LAMI
MERIRCSRRFMKEWNEDHFGNIRHKSKKLNSRICEILKGPITSAAWTEVEKLKDSLDILGTREEMLWKQRAKALWLKAGDSNTSFFHVKANERRLRKEIKKIRDERGTEVRDIGGVWKVISRYFQSIFESSHPTTEAI